MIQLQSLTKQINSTILCDAIDLTIYPWTIHSIIGPSWSGKSSLLRCIAAIDSVSGGTVSIDGTYITPQNLPHYPFIYLMSQSSDLRPHMTIQENITFPLKKRGIYNHWRYVELMHSLHISHLAEKYPSQCSGWEQQRAAFARAILLRAKYLLLDEATSALDLEHIQIVWDIIKKNKQHTAICLVTHMIHFAKSISDYIHFMDRGKIIESWSDILENPKTQRLQTFLQHY